MAGGPANDQNHDERAGLREQRHGELPAVEHHHGGFPSSPGSGATTLSRTYCSHHGLGRGLGSTRVVGSVALFCMAAARREAAG